MKTLTYSLKRIADGFLLGVGFMIPLVVASMVTSCIYFSELEQAMDFDFDYDYIEFSPDTPLVIGEETFVLQDEQNAHILGTIRNDSEQTWSGTTIEIELLDEKGALLDEFTHYVEAPVPPGGQERFKADMAYCDGDEFPPFHDYTIRIVDSFKDDY